MINDGNHFDNFQKNVDEIDYNSLIVSNDLKEHADQKIVN